MGGASRRQAERLQMDAEHRPEDQQRRRRHGTAEACGGQACGAQGRGETAELRLYSLRAPQAALACASPSCAPGKGCQSVTVTGLPCANQVVPLQMALIHLPSCMAVTVTKGCGMPSVGSASENHFVVM